MPSTLKRKYKPTKKKKRHPWYDLVIWRNHIRPAHLRKEPICQDCKDEGVINGKQREVDHIKPWQTGKDEAERWRLFTDMDNLKTRCKRHHAKKTLCQVH